MEEQSTVFFNLHLISGYNVVCRSSLHELFKYKTTILITSPTSYKIVEKTVSECFLIKDLIITKGRMSISEADEYVLKCKGNRESLIIGVGGGSVLDLSKYIAQKCSTQLAVIPTILSSNALASPFSVLELDSGELMTLRTKGPDLIIADFSILEGQPKKFILSGFGDLIAKYTSITDYIYSNMVEGRTYNRVAVNLARNLLKITLNNSMLLTSGTRDGLELLLHLLILDGYLMELAGTSRIVAGCEHLVAYGIEKVARKGLHGEQVALGTLICSYLQNKNWLALKELFSRITLPVRASQLGLSDEELIKALTIAPRTRDWLTVLGKAELKKETVQRILTELNMLS